MKTLSDQEIDEYINGEEWLEKAGSYSIQGSALSFFPFISGCFSNVFGLPLPKLINVLSTMGFYSRKK
jgi:Nucleotide-binding protein implicated in inhibition of septum formation